MTGLIRSLIRHPTLAAEAVRASWALAPRGWWRQPPFLPVPDRGYVRWRVETAYGSTDAAVEVEDLLHYLAWRRAQRRIR